jgi:HAD superfamily hydrolase (TIGR01490 family)
LTKDYLKNKKIAITGATGFLGTALVERLLTLSDTCELYLLVRPGQKVTATDRVLKEIIKNDCFNSLRSRLKDDFMRVVSTRVFALAGDVGIDTLGLSENDLKLLSDCDIVIHSAAAVSFDAPLDQAVEINLLGPTRVLQTLQFAKDKFANDKPVHFTAVSTAYVSGGLRGLVKEMLPNDDPNLLEINIDAEIQYAKTLRQDLEIRSRSKEMIDNFEKQAKHQLGAAGKPILVKKSESLRQDWIKNSLVEAGIKRAQMLGWPDAYAYTKCLGERLLISNINSEYLSIVRPSIIESSLKFPYPGWIRGFRMAEPIIISYAKGLLKEFPGVPEGTIDVIPVDLVVDTIIGVCMRTELPKTPEVIHCASGHRNPLKYGMLVKLVQEYFTQNPLYDNQGQPIVVPKWSFPGRGRVQGQLHKTVNILNKTEHLLGRIPLRGSAAQFITNLEEKKLLTQRALTYVELYGAYTETEAIFAVENLLELKKSLGDAGDLLLDPNEINWTRYVQEIHLPSIIKHARVKTSPTKKDGNQRSQRALKQILSDNRQMAVFDLENTLVASNVVDAYAWLATRHLDGFQKSKLIADLVKSSKSLWAQDRKDRSDFLRFFYRNYENATYDSLAYDSVELLTDFLIKRSFPAGISRVRQHRQLGHKTLLITGALEFIVDPFKDLFDDIVSATMTVDNAGKLTGELDNLPPVGEIRAQIIKEYADSNDIDLKESVAYADSTSDLPMLEAVGFPVAVNPETKLYSLANKRGWHIESWPKTPKGRRAYLPVYNSKESNSPFIQTKNALKEAVSNSINYIINSTK